MSYRVSYESRAARELSKLDKPIARRVHAAVLALADDPRPAGCQKLAGSREWRKIRVGDYRIIYTVDDEVLLVAVVRIGHRRAIYRRL